MNYLKKLTKFPFASQTKSVPEYAINGAFTETPFSNYSKKQKKEQPQNNFKEFPQKSSQFSMIPVQRDTQNYQSKDKMQKKKPKTFHSPEQLSLILKPQYFSIKDMSHFEEILKFLESNKNIIDHTNIMNVLLKFADYLRFQTFVQTGRQNIENKKYLLEVNYLQDVNQRKSYLPTLSETCQSLIICDMLIYLQESYQLTHQEVLNIFSNNFQIYYVITNQKSFIQSGKEITQEEQKKIEEYEKNLPIPYEYEEKLINLLEYQLDVLYQDYENLALLNKIQLCKIMKRTRVFNHSLTELIIFDLQNNWTTMELQDLVPVLQAVIRSGNALPNELIYAMRDYFQKSDIKTFKAKDTILLLDIFVRSRLRFFDQLIERLFTNLVEENKFKHLALSDKVMSLHLYAKSITFRNEKFEKFLVEKQEAQIKNLSLIQIKIFLSSLAEMRYGDTELFLRLKEQIDLVGYIGEIQEFAKLSPIEKEYFKMIIEILSKQNEEIVKN